MKRKNLSPMRAIFALLIGVCLAGFTAVQAEEGEDGESDVERTLFDLRVSYYDSGANANARRTAIEANFRYFAEALYEATNGAHQLRNVTIYVDGAFKDNADVVWVEKCHPNAHINGRNRTGYRIEHCDHFGDSQNYLESTMWGGYTLMHEWGHFAYGLFDEYQNEDAACDPDDPSGPCQDDTPVPNSVMHNQDNAGTENNQLQDAAWLNFSTARNNTKKTAQHRVYSLSGWETLVRNSQQDSDDVVYYSNNLRRSYYANLSQVAPTQESDPVLIITDPQNRQDATSALSFSWKTAAVGTRSERRARAEHMAAVEALDTTRVTKQMAEDEMLSVAKLLVIENSERLSAAMLESVKDAAGQLIDGAVIGDTIAILSFGATALAILPANILIGECQAGHFAPRTQPLTAGLSL